eukprot:scaffold322402_cov22-Prasinocladus_malaysianus.AAC.1
MLHPASCAVACFVITLLAQHGRNSIFTCCSQSQIVCASYAAYHPKSLSPVAVIRCAGRT